MSSFLSFNSSFLFLKLIMLIFSSKHIYIMFFQFCFIHFCCFISLFPNLAYKFHQFPEKRTIFCPIIHFFFSLSLIHFVCSIFSSFFLQQAWTFVVYYAHTYTNISGNIIKDNDELQWTNELGSWCNGYGRRKWTRWHEFKPWTRLITFHIALIPLGKVWIQLFSLQLWVNSATDGSSALVRQRV